MERAGVDVAELNGPEMPKGSEYLYGWFCEVFSGQLIAWQEIEAWSRLKGIELQPWEAGLIRTLSMEYISG